MNGDIDIKKLVKIGCLVIGVLLVLVFFFNSVKFLAAGEKAVVFNRFTGNINRSLSQGINFVNPLTDKVKKYDIKLQKEEWEKIEGMSADNQTIELDLVINYRFSPDKLKEIYQEIQGDVRFTVLDNAVSEISKTSLGKFKIDEIAKNREMLKENMEEALKERAAKYYMTVENISITNVNYSDEYDKAVERKLVAEQKAKEADHLKNAIIAEARGKAESNRLIRQTVTPLVLRQKFIEKWDGKLPVYMLGKDAGLLLNMSK